MAMRCLVIDHYDSFTWNLVHMLALVNGEEPRLVQHDQISWQEIVDYSPDQVILSPGPGNPERTADFMVSRQVLNYGRMPILGVCLGHQGIGFAFGGRVIRAPEPRHGRASLVRHHGRDLFKDLPNPFSVIRYHSLVVAEPLPADLEVTARLWNSTSVTSELADLDSIDAASNAAALVMGLRHRSRPIWGVQFHPESILTEYGAQILANFRDLSRSHAPRRKIFAATMAKSTVGQVQTPEDNSPPSGSESLSTIAPNSHNGFAKLWRKLEIACDGEAVFMALFHDQPNQPLRFWLDSATSTQGRWSFLGAATEKCDFDRSAPFWHWLESQKVDSSSQNESPPVPFSGGWVGWIGYEADAQNRQNTRTAAPPELAQSSLPMVRFMRVNRLIAIDHQSGCCYIISRHRFADAGEAEQWIEAVTATLSDLVAPEPAMPLDRKLPPCEFALAHSQEDYYAVVEQAKAWITAGEAYQVCMTTKIATKNFGIDPLSLYRIFRRINPAPHAAFLAWDGDATGAEKGGAPTRGYNGAVVSASPERFLSGSRDGRLEARPIKGTARRDPNPQKDQEIAFALAGSEKDRAENLMIVDLLRNDLSQVCLAGTVKVPSLLAIESFATVHQLVSTITGQVHAGQHPFTAIKSAFPGGSMTGAPKRRAMELLGEIERGERGIYSGAIGWLGDDGAFDLSVVIRTIVCTPDRLTIGVGGGIVAQSTPEGEFTEMRLKAAAPMRAIALASHGREESPIVHGVAATRAFPS